MSLSSDLDPVCGMRVDPAHPKGGTHVHAGKTYGFCNPRCRERFAAEPGRYLATPARSRCAPEHGCMPHTAEHGGAPVSWHRRRPAGVWVCPMDPEVASAQPGACPRCGMAPRAEGARRRDRHPVGLPDAPADRPGCAGHVPHLRDGARTADGDPRRASESRAAGHAASPPGGRSVHRRAARRRDGRDGGLAFTVVDRLGRAPPRHAGRALGGRSVLRPGGRLNPQPEPEHVHPHRARGRRRLRLQPRRHARSGHAFPRPSAVTADG